MFCLEYSDNNDKYKKQFTHYFKLVGEEEEVRRVRKTLKRTIEELQSTKVFQVPLQELMSRKTENDSIPKMVRQCMNSIMSGGLATEGILRISGGQDKIFEVKDIFDRGGIVDLRTHSVHTAAGLLKLFLRQLPEPLIPFSSYSTWISKSSFLQQQERERKLTKEVIKKTIKELVSSLPPPNQALIKEVALFLEKVISNSSINKMTSSNVSIVFTPNLLYIPVDPNNPNELLNSSGDVSGANELFTHFLENVKEIFDEEKNKSPKQSPSSPSSPSSPTSLAVASPRKLVSDTSRASKVVSNPTEIKEKLGCSFCGEEMDPQKDTTVLKFKNGTYHKQCLVCEYCNKPLMGFFMIVDNVKVCNRDYLKLFGERCPHCLYPSELGDRCTILANRVWHDDHIKCAKCEVSLLGYKEDELLEKYGDFYCPKCVSLHKRLFSSQFTL